MNNLYTQRRITIDSFSLSQYQKQGRNATFASLFRHPQSPRCRWHVRWQKILLHVLLLQFVIFYPAIFDTQPDQHLFYQVAQAQTLNDSSSAPFVYVLPTDLAAIQLQTHTADVSMLEDGTGGFLLQIKSFFRLKNSLKTDATTIVQIGSSAVSSSASSAASHALPADLQVTIAGEPAPLQPGENGALLLPVQLAGEAHLDINLLYTLAPPILAGSNTAQNPLQQVAYSVEPLRAWQRSISLRINFAIPSTLAKESWLEVNPEDWRPPNPAANEASGLKWLAEGDPAQQPFSLTFIHPVRWQEMVARRQRIASNPPPATLGNEFFQLGNFYLDLFQQISHTVSPTASPISSPIQRQAFYAQALAAYQDALTQVGLDPSLPVSLTVDLQRSIAQLYRSQIVESNGAINPAYARLTIETVDGALALLPAEDAKRSEMLQWRADSVTVLLNDARQQRDWSTALQLLDNLNSSATVTATTSENGGQPFIGQMRRKLMVQQALQLLEEGNRTAAIAIAGTAFDAAQLRPPADQQSLFASWLVTITVSAAGIEMDWLGSAAAEQSESARASLKNLVNLWQSRTSTYGTVASFQEIIFQELAGQAGSSQESQSERISSSNGGTKEDRTESVQFLINLRVPSNASLLRLVESTPLRSDWVLMRAIFSQLSPTIEQGDGFFRHRTTIRQAIDLRTVGEQWHTIAQNLETRAAAFETQTTAIAGENGETSQQENDAERRLQLQVQAANYRNAAHTWSNLAQSTSAIISLVAVNQTSQAGDGGIASLSQAHGRTWLATPSSPPQTLVFEYLATNWGWVVASLLLTGFFLFLLAGVLWGLL